MLPHAQLKMARGPTQHSSRRVTFDVTALDITCGIRCVSTTTGWTVMNLGTHIRLPRGMNRNHFGDPVMFEPCPHQVEMTVCPVLWFVVGVVHSALLLSSCLSFIVNLLCWPKRKAWLRKFIHRKEVTRVERATALRSGGSVTWR